MRKDQRYSVVIPAWNAQSTIVETLDSIWQQTVLPTEVIVIDDGSTDQTVTVASSCRLPVTIVSQDNRGPGAATSAGLALVSTSLVAMLDSDDLWLPDKIERQLAFLNSSTDVQFIFGHMQTFSGMADNRVAPPVPGWSRITLLAYTEAARSVGPFVDQPGKVGEMIDWLARARSVGIRDCMLPDLLSLRRLRPDSLSSINNQARNSGYLEVARLAILRRKQQLSQ